MTRKKKDTGDDFRVTEQAGDTVTINDISGTPTALSVESEALLKEGLEDVEQGKVQPLELPKKIAVRTKTKRVKRMNFDTYARMKGIRATRVAGMRAFTGNPRIPRTVEEWDFFFEKY